MNQSSFHRASLAYQRYLRGGEPDDLYAAVHESADALRLTASDDHQLPERLTLHARTLLARFDHAGDAADLDTSIALLKRGIHMTPGGDPRLPGRLDAYAEALAARLVALRTFSDLEEAIHALRSAVDLTPPQDPSFVSRVTGLSSGLRVRFLARGDLTDCDEAIAINVRLLEATPPNSPLLPGILDSVVGALFSRHDRIGDARDLESALRYAAEAIRLTSPADALLLDRILKIAELLNSQFYAFGDARDLDRALSYVEQAENILAESGATPHYSQTLRAGILLARSRAQGSTADLEECICLYGALASQLPASNPIRETVMVDLATARLEHFRRFGDPVELDLVIAGYEDCLQLTKDENDLPLSDPSLEWSNYSAALQERYSLTHRPADLDSAILAAERAIHGTPPGHVRMPVYLNNHAKALVRRHYATQAPADLNTALAEYDRAVQLSPENNRAQWTAGHANALLRRYHYSQDPDDLDTAVAELRQAIGAAPRGVFTAVWMNDRANALYERYRVTRDPADALAAIGDRYGATSSAWSQPVLLARSMHELTADLDRLSGDPTAPQLDELLTRVARGHLTPAIEYAHGGLARWTPGLAGRALERLRVLGQVTGPRAWAESLREVQGLASVGAFMAAQAGDLETAVNLIELGSGVLASARLEQQDAILTLLERHGHSAAVQDYRAAADALGAATRRDDDTATIEALPKRLISARSVIEDLWGEPLAPSATLHDINRLVSDGIPLSWLTATSTGGLVLTATHNPTGHTPHITATTLPQLTTATIDDWINSITSAPEPSPGATRGAWRLAPGTQPPHTSLLDLPHQIHEAIRPAIGAIAPPDATVIRLIPVGALANLPWTATLNTTDRVIGVSVAASAKLHQLTLTPNTATAPPQDGWLAAITNPRHTTWNHHPLPDLPAATLEGLWLADRYHATHLDGSDATLTNAKRLLTTPELRALHVSTHGDITAAGAHLILTNPNPHNTSTDTQADTLDTTALPSLTGLHHVFLASCWTAHPNPALPDENQSLPTTFITTGSHAVTAPLWPVHDNTTKLLVQRYYRNWLDKHQPPALALAHAIHTIRNTHTPHDHVLLTLNAFNTTGGATTS